MRLLLFMSRVALLCNALFLVCLAVQRTHDFINNQNISNYVITLGWFVSPFVNLIVTGWWLFAKLFKKGKLPLWLGIVNLLFLLLQFFVFFILRP